MCLGSKIPHEKKEKKKQKQTRKRNKHMIKRDVKERQIGRYKNYKIFFSNVNFFC